jgi:tRNA(His) 5'-end guanylyltransferase
LAFLFAFDVSGHQDAVVQDVQDSILIAFVFNQELSILGKRAKTRYLVNDTNKKTLFSSADSHSFAPLKVGKRNVAFAPSIVVVFGLHDLKRSLAERLVMLKQVLSIHGE